MSASRVLVDTGPLVAWLDSADADHDRARHWFAGFKGELLAPWPVLTEVCHLLPERIVPRFMRWVANGGLTVLEMPAAAAGAIADRMGKYADLPMDLADAALLYLAEYHGIMDVATLDERDFGIYRTARGKAVRNVLAHRPTKSRRGR